jgi:outer membrane protein
MNKHILIAAFAILPLQLFAQTYWTLKDCIAYGLKNNRSNTIYDNEKREADAKAKEALAAYLPSVNITGTVDDNLKVQETIIPAGIFGPTDLHVAFTKQYQSNAVAQLDQTIYDQALITGLRANRYNSRQAALNVVKNQEDIIYNISDAFFQILVYKEQLSLLHNNEATYKDEMQITKLRVEKGVALQKDLDKVTVDYNNAISNIHVAESNLTLSENQLKYAMGFPFRDSLAIDSAAGNHMAQAATKPVPLDDTAFNATTRTDYQLSQINAQLLNIDQQRIRAGMWPKLTAYARYGYIGFGDRLNQSFNTASSYSAIGIKLSIPLLDFFKRNAQYKQAEYKSLNAYEQLKLDEDKYRIDFQNARTKLLKQQGDVDNNRRNIELALSVLSVTSLQYEKGTTDLTDWLNAQNSVKEAQNNYLNSLYNFFLARIDMEKAGGTLKNFYSAL